MMEDAEAKLDSVISKQEITIENRSDLLEIEKVFKNIQQEYKLFDKKIQEIAIVADELAENILQHSGNGKMTILYHHSAMPFIEIISENIGELPERATEDGITTKHSLGIGLGIISRRSDVFTHEQDGKVLRIHVIKYCEDFPARSEVAVLSFPVLMNEKCNGDSFLIHKDHSDLFCVIDALGHGESAYKSAVAVHDFIQENPNRGIDAIIYEAHRFIQSQRLRGVALSGVRVEYESNTIQFCGLGDVMVKIFLPDEDKVFYPLPKEGIVGDVYRTLEIQRFPIIKGAIIAIFTDGVSSKLSISLSQRNENPINLVNDLMKLYGKDYDDRTLLLAKIL